MWIKLCGNTSLGDARLCVSAGPDALGFIFAPRSKRFLTPEQTARICQAIAREFPAIERIGVFTEGDATHISATASQCVLTGIQLQSAETQSQAPALRTMHPELKIISAFPWAGAADFTQRLATNQRSPVFNAFLVDHGPGGTGQPFPWSSAATSFAQAQALDFPVIAAGGLLPENVTEAVTILRPWGIDAVSGLESSPGCKDSARVRAFVAAGRASQRA